jgi:hypothetical protein
MDFSVTKEDIKLRIIKKINILKTYIPVEKYDSFKMLINGWNNKKYREVVLKKG